MNEWMAIIHVKEEVYLIDREAYFLLCRIQEVKFGFEYVSERDYEKQKMYEIILDWLVDNKKAIKLAGRPHHLIIKFEED